MSEGRTTDPQRGEPSNRPQPIIVVFTALAAVAAVAGPVISVIEGGRIAFHVGICLIIAGGAVLVAVVAHLISRSGRVRRVPPRWWQAMTAGVSIILVVVGVILVATQHSNVATQHSNSAQCQTPARISGADTSALQFTVTVDLVCTMPSGNQLFLVEQLLGQGKPGTVKHSEYYLGWDVRDAVGLHSFADSPSGCATRRYYLISVTQDQLDLLEQSQRASSGSYFGEPIDTVISRYIVSNQQTNHTCNKQA